MMTIDRDEMHTILDAVLDAFERGNGYIRFELTAIMMTVIDARASTFAPKIIWEHPDAVTAETTRKVIDALEKPEADTNPHGDARL